MVKKRRGQRWTPPLRWVELIAQGTIIGIKPAHDIGPDCRELACHSQKMAAQSGVNEGNGASSGRGILSPGSVDRSSSARAFHAMIVGPAGREFPEMIERIETVGDDRGCEPRPRMARVTLPPARARASTSGHDVSRASWPSSSRRAPSPA